MGQITFTNPKLKSYCHKHKSEYSFIIGKHFRTLYFIPINYFWAKEEVFRICDKCKNDEYEQVPSKTEKIILRCYHNKISHDECERQLCSVLSDLKKQRAVEKEQDEKYLAQTFKIAGIIILGLIALVILKAILG